MSAYIDAIKELSIPIIDLKASNLYNPLLIFRIKKIIDSNNFDIVHTHLFPSLYWSSVALRNRKNGILVYTEHSNYNKRRKNVVLKMIDRIAYKSYDAVIAISNEVKRNLIKNIKITPPVSVIPNGVDLRFIFEAQELGKENLTKLFKIPPNSYTILMVASFRYPKDQKTLITSLKYLNDNYHVLLAGEGDMMSKVEEYSKQQNTLDRIHFLGFRTDISSLMKSVDINVLSSDYEGMSGVTLESLASGKPFLGSDVPGINDIVPDKRFLFEKGNARDLADKIQKIINNPKLAEDMSATGLEYVKQFDMGIMIDRHIKLYEELLSQRNN